MSENENNIETNDAPVEEVTQHEEVTETKVEEAAPPAEEHQEEEDLSEKSIDELPLPGVEPEEDKKKEIPKWLQKKLNREKRIAEEKEAEAQLYKSELERVRTNPQQQQQVVMDDKPPQRDQFATEDEYIDARIDYKNRKSFKEQQVQSHQQALVQGELEFRKKFGAAVEAGNEKYDDFDEKTKVLFKPEFPSNRAMAEAIVDSEYRSDILYFLAEYPDHAKQIALSNPVQAIKKIHDIESRFKAAKKPNVSKAPPLLKPLNTNKGGVSDGNPSNMAQNDFENWYQSKYGKR